MGSQKSLILVINQETPSVAETNASSSFDELKIWERNHIQEWIKNSSEILGEDLLVLSSEFNKFDKSNDRLDVLALDKKGNLVIIELKRDSMAGYADLQAIRYAALISTLTLKTVLPYFVDFYNKENKDAHITSEKAEEIIQEFTDNDFIDFTQKPRIILCSENFSTELTTTVLWLLNHYGIDITCVRIKPHKVKETIIIVPTIIIPIPEAKQYQILVQQKEEAIEIENSKRTKRPTSIRMLLEEGKIQKGDILRLHKDLLPSALQPYFETQNEDFYTAIVTGKAGKANNVLWQFDGNEYSITNLSHQIFLNIHPRKEHPGALSGADYWRAENGKTLYQWANEVWAEKV